MKVLISQNRYSLASFLTVFFLMVLVLGVLGLKANLKYKTYLTAKSQLASTHSETFQKLEDTDFLLASKARFDARLNSGVIGPVERIVWVEALEDIRQSLALDDFYYNINPSENSSGNNDVVISVASIDLRAGFPHDEALFKFYGRLKETINAGYEIAELEIIRAPKKKTAASPTAKQKVNLIATTRIDWVSILPQLKNDSGDLQGI